MSRIITIDGMPVSNGKKKLVIQINSRDTKRGKSKDPQSCAAALACKRGIPKCTQARVHISRTYLKIDGKWVRYGTPAALRSEIIAFDRGAPFSPGEYRLSPLRPSSQVAGQQGGVNRRKKTGKKRRPYHVVSGVRHLGDVQ